MSRHVSLCWLLWDKLQGETDITGLWTLIICSQVSRPDYLIIFSPIYITINPRDTNSRGWSQSSSLPSLQTEKQLTSIPNLDTVFHFSPPEVVASPGYQYSQYSSREDLADTAAPDLNTFVDYKKVVGQLENSKFY